MKVILFVRRLKDRAYPMFIWRRADEWLLRFYGFNLDPGETLYVEPVYLPTLKIQNSGGQTIIDFRFPWMEQCWTVILMGVPPYIWIGKSTHIVLEDYDDED